MVSTRPRISKSFSLCTNPLLTVLSASITIGITITFIFHSFFSSLARSRYLSLFSLSFSFTLRLVGTAKSTIRQVLFCLLTIIWSSHLAEIHLYHKIPKKFVCLILQDGFRVVHIPFVCMVNFQFLAQFPVDHLPTQSCLVFYSFCASLLYSLRLYRHITYICYFVWSYQFFL